MNWVRGAEIPGESKQTTWWALPEPRSVSEFRAHWKLWADGRDYSGNDGGCNQDGRPGACQIGAGGGPGAMLASTYFPGGGNCFRSGSGSAVQITIPMTWAAWVYPTAASQGCGFINHYHNGTHIPFYSLLGTFVAGGLWVVGAYHISLGHTYIHNGFYPPVNTWTWLCYTVDASRNVVMYINGSAPGGQSASALGYVPAGCDQDLFIGARWDGAAFVGYMTDVRLYNVAISAAEVLEIYRRSTNTQPAPSWVPVG